ncbi:MAG TPA: alpha/beta hydrolase [Actinomycetota bacterium]|jgi:pimeloyl-ACP methyl ester carboxylesterase|nr:alpha/beta hydrolase [Actinomycetota bacterium]
MSAIATATTADERPVFFTAGGETLFGVVTLPKGEPLGIGFVILCGGAIPISPNRNRHSVHLCRHLATLGYTCMRFDYHGAGESTGLVSRVDLGRTHVDDAIGAVQVLRDHGATRIIVAGSCGGARNAVGAAKSVPDLESLILFDMPLRTYERGKDRAHERAAKQWSLGQYVRRALRLRTIRGIFDKRLRRAYGAFARERLRAAKEGSRRPEEPQERQERTASSVLEELRGIAQRGIPTLLVYGDADEYYSDVEIGLKGELGTILREASPSMELTVLPGEVHGFASLEMQHTLRQIVYDRLGSR